MSPSRGRADAAGRPQLQRDAAEAVPGVAQLFADAGDLLADLRLAVQGKGLSHSSLLEAGLSPASIVRGPSA